MLVIRLVPVKEDPEARQQRAIRRKARIAAKNAIKAANVTKRKLFSFSH